MNRSKTNAMKTVVITLCLWMSALVLQAANPVRLTQGDPSVFHQEGTVYVVIDDHTTLIDRTDQTADVYYGNKSEAEYQKFLEDVDRGHASFITYFNEKHPGQTLLTMSDVEEQATYILQVNVSLMNVGNAGGMIWGMSRKAGGALINGTMQLLDKETGEVLCEFEFEKVKGLMAPVFQARVISVYRYLADGLLKAIQ